MILQPRDTRYAPDIQVQVTSTADMLTGDGVFADTDLVRIPYDGYLILNAVTSAGSIGDDGTGKLYVPQIHHQENRFSNLPILNGGTSPDVEHMINYKIPIHRGETPRVLYDEEDAATAHFTGCFYRGMNRKSINNPVAYNTPDIVVYKSIAATSQNVLESTDLEDCPFPGILLIWASGVDSASTIQIMQKGHQTGNTSAIPLWPVGGGSNAVNCAAPPYKCYVPATGNPTVTVTVSTTVSVCAAFYIDWAAVSPIMRSRMGY